MCNGKSCHSTTPGPYDLLSAGQPNDACMCAYGAPSSPSELRWTPRMVVNVEVIVVHLLLAGVANPTLVVVPGLVLDQVASE